MGAGVMTAGDRFQVEEVGEPRALPSADATRTVVAR